MTEDTLRQDAESVRKRLTSHAIEHQIRLNPEEETVSGVIKAMVMRREKYGKLYCPCRRVTGNAETDDKIICPCVYHLEEIARDGHCHCHLFVAAEGSAEV